MPPNQGGVPGVTAVTSQVSAGAQAAVPAAAQAAAADAGIDPNGPEMQALLALSRDVVERIVWEVVPELAETIIRENLDRLTANRQ